MNASALESRAEIVEETVLLEVSCRPRDYKGRKCSLLVLKDITHALRQEKLQSEFLYQKALI